MKLPPMTPTPCKVAVLATDGVVTSGAPGLAAVSTYGCRKLFLVAALISTQPVGCGAKIHTVAAVMPHG
jgi:hypothetical protein